MRGFFIAPQKNICCRCLSGLLACLLSVSLTFGPTASYAQSTNPLNLPVPGAMVAPSPAFVPVLLKGMTIHPEDPLEFDFIIDSGNTNFAADQIKRESEKLVKYFLASMTIPKDDLWVNLSPHEEDRIIPDELGKTELGRDMLAQDYILKQLTASLMYPEEEIGKKFWDRIYERVKKEFGTSEIPVNTFNKVWILPETATVYEHEQTVYVVDAHLKVMLDSDYQALRYEKENGRLKGQDLSSSLDLQSSIVKEIIIPEIEREVNEGENFAPLRQIYHSLILAKWYKETVKNSLLSQVYADKKLTDGVSVDDETIKDQIYARYVEAYKKGVFDYIKEDYDRLSQEYIPRKYFSGGESLVNVPLEVVESSSPISKSGFTGKGYEVRAAVIPQKDGTSRSSSPLTRREREELLDAAAEQFGLGKVDRDYTGQLWKQAYERLYSADKKDVKEALRIIVDRQDPQDQGNFILAKDLEKDQRQNWLGEEMYGVLTTDANAAAAEDIIVTLNSMDGGIGEGVDRLDFLLQLTLEELEKQGREVEDIELIADKTGRKISYRVKVRGEKDAIEVTRGAKGTDLGFKVQVAVDGNLETVFVSIAEIKLLQIIEIAQKGLFRGLRFQPLVNWQSKLSYVKLLNKPYLYDTSMTYGEYLKSLGVELPEMLEQADLPWIDKESGRITLNSDNPETGSRYRQPGGHGQWGFLFLWETYERPLPQDGATRIRLFYNGDNINSRVSEHIAGAMKNNFWPIVKLTTRATPIDRKGGKDGVRIMKIDGKEVFVPDQMEVADATAKGQGDIFFSAGQKEGEDQPFNTNIFYINTTVLHAILSRLRQRLDEKGQNGEERIKEIISPTYIEKDDQTGEDGKKYIPIDGAIGTAMHNINSFFLTDPIGQDVLAEVKEELGIEGKFDRILHFVNIPRTEFFVPVKNNFDVTLQNSDYYTFTPDPERPRGWIRKDAVPGSVPPQITWLPKKGFWTEQQNHLEAFGENLSVRQRELKSLEIEREVLLKDANLGGHVKIFNKSGGRIDLNSATYKKSNPELFEDGRLTLVDKTVYILEDKTLEVKQTEQPSSDALPSSPVGDEEVGGIDMNDITVDRQGDGVDIQFDPVEIRNIIDAGITGFAPVIIDITPLPTVLPLLGLAPQRKEEGFEVATLIKEASAPVRNLMVAVRRINKK